jgi:deazaflavin-dependent oxidoreductase (nitroreductase family)
VRGRRTSATAAGSLQVRHDERTNAVPLFGKEHVDRYEATGGAEGHDWEQGTTILILHTRGRKSGKQYKHPLIYREAPDASGHYVIVASKGGAPESPEWFRNLEADPDTTIQVKDRTIPVRARVAHGDERATLWRHMAESWPAYDDYKTKTDREIPVVVLDPR